jgi:hypothetical protein
MTISPWTVLCPLKFVNPIEICQKYYRKSQILWLPKKSLVTLFMIQNFHFLGIFTSLVSSVLLLTTKTSFLLIFDTYELKNYQNNEISQLAYLIKIAPIIIFELVSWFVKQWDILEEKNSTDSENSQDL